MEIKSASLKIQMNVFHFWQHSSHIIKIQNSYSMRNVSKNKQTPCDSPSLWPAIATVPSCFLCSPHHHSHPPPGKCQLLSILLLSPAERCHDKRQKCHQLMTRSMEQHPFPGTASLWDSFLPRDLVDVCQYIHQLSGGGKKGEGWQGDYKKQANTRKDPNPLLCYSFLICQIHVMHNRQVPYNSLFLWWSGIFQMKKQVWVLSLSTLLHSSSEDKCRIWAAAGSCYQYQQWQCPWGPQEMRHGSPGTRHMCGATCDLRHFIYDFREWRRGGRTSQRKDWFWILSCNFFKFRHVTEATLTFAHHFLCVSLYSIKYFLFPLIEESSIYWVQAYLTLLKK